MISRVLAVLVFASPWLASAQPMEMPSRTLEGQAAAPASFRAPALVPVDLVTLAAPQQQKSVTAAPVVPNAPLKIGDVRALTRAAPVANWTRVAGGYVAKFRTSSESALGIRMKIELGTVPGSFEVRVQSGDLGRIETSVIDPALGNEHWTPWTEGSSQIVELFSAVEPSAGAVGVGAVVHFTDSPFTAKAAGTCTVSTMCSTSNPVLDAAILERKRSIAKLNYQVGSGSYLCTGTLLNTERFPAPFVITANHCIDNSTVASTLATFWFYESTGCGVAGVNPGWVQVSSGAQLTFTNYNVDSTLLRLNANPPVGAVYSAWNRAAVANGTSFVSLSHPSGDTARLALGTLSQQYRIDGRPIDMYGVRFTRGIVEGGSSGSGLFVLNGTSLQLRGVLSGTTVRNSSDGLTCTNLNEEGLYTRLEAFQPEIDQYIRLAAQAADDAPNRFQEVTADIGATSTTANRRIDYAGDVDVYRFTLAAPTTVHAWSTGSIDTVGSILDSRGVNLEANDDETAGSTNFNFGITRSLAAGTYYVQVTHFDPDGTGTYTLNLSATAAAPPNYTDLWWNAAESGWGLNLNHQGSVVFGTLFTYDAQGQPMWLVLARGDQQADGSFRGALYRTTGPAFNAVPFTATTPVEVGTMRVAFTNLGAGTLTYSVDGVNVTKSITRQVFSTPPVCTFTSASRNSATNYQDLWWNPAEPGWGINVTHQGNVIFATLFTYDATGKAIWYVLARAERTGTGAYSGALFRTRGPVFNAVPWVATTTTQVGSMSFAFTNGGTGTLTYTVDGVQVTKAIQRETFSSPTSVCAQP
jgi:hypothetical protein